MTTTIFTFILSSSCLTHPRKTVSTIIPTSTPEANFSKETNNIIIHPTHIKIQWLCSWNLLHCTFPLCPTILPPFFCPACPQKGTSQANLYHYLIQNSKNQSLQANRCNTMIIQPNPFHDLPNTHPNWITTLTKKTSLLIKRMPLPYVNIYHRSS